jgi:hypothetical protein
MKAISAKALEQVVADLAGREAIIELPSRYCDLCGKALSMESSDWLAENGTNRYRRRGRGMKVAGRDNLVAAYRQQLSTQKMRPFIHNHVSTWKEMDAPLRGATCRFERCEEYGMLQPAIIPMNTRRSANGGICVFTPSNDERMTHELPRFGRPR